MANNMLFRIIKLKKYYQMGEVTVKALREVNLEIYKGEFLTVIGPSGSGKSTLLNIIGGLDSLTDGQIFFKDTNLSEYNERERTLYRRNNIGFVFQFYNLISNLTAEENVEMATEISENAMNPKEVLDLVELSERRSHFPSQLSGGEQQRVAIARAVAKRPEVLLCDEPTGALDYATGKIVLKLLNEISKQTQTTVVIITHNSAIGGMGDRVVKMKDGMITEVIKNEKLLSIEEIEW